MTKEKYYEFNVGGHDYRIYTMEYLDALDFTDDEIDDFIEGDDLYNSYCVGVMCELNPGMSMEQAIEVMSGDVFWFKKYPWTPVERVFYEKRFTPIIMKVLDYDLDEAWHEAEIWSGFGSVPIMSGDDAYEEYTRLHEEAYKEVKEKEK